MCLASRSAESTSGISGRHYDNLSIAMSNEGVCLMAVQHLHIMALHEVNVLTDIPAAFAGD